MSHAGCADYEGWIGQVDPYEVHAGVTRPRPESLPLSYTN